MNAYLTMCRIEARKLRRTLAFWMMFIAPAVVVSLQLMVWANRKSAFDVDADLWLQFQQNILSMWGIFMQPLFLALVVALVYHIDHASQGWLRMFVWPVPRWTVPAAKLTIVLLMLVFATAALLGLTIGGTWLAQALNSRITLPDEIPFAELVRRTWLVLVTSILVLGIQNAVSLRFASLPVSLGVGITGTFVALFAASWKYGPYYPWLMPLHVLHGKEVVVRRILWLSPTLALLVIAATLLYAIRKDPGTYGS